MCSICGGNVCAGTGGCTEIIRHTPEIVKISYSYTGNIITTIQNYCIAMFIATKEQLLEAMHYLKLRR